MINRLSKLKNDLKKQNIDAILVSSVPNITYLTGYSGFSKDEREAFLLITTSEQYILTDKRYAEEIKNSSRSSYAGLRTINYFEMVEVSSSIPFGIALEKLIKEHKVKKIGIEVDNLTVSEYITLKKIFKSGSSLISFQISENRSIKEQEEVDAIEKACKLTDKTFDYILTKIQPGITEKELGYDIESFIKRSGGDLAFEPIVAFGKNSSIPHHKASSSVIPNLIGNPRPLDSRFSPKGTSSPGRVARGNDNNENIILLDFGSKVDNYCSDMTRVVFLGKATYEQKKIYKTVLEAQHKAIEYIDNLYSSSPSINTQGKLESRSLNTDSSRLRSNNNIIATDVDKTAHDYIRSQGYGENIFHSLGHGVGLEIHESPRLSKKSKETLNPGMVFTIEPGIYLPNKFGIRIEDTVVLEKNGLRILTKSPKALTEL